MSECTRMIGMNMDVNYHIHQYRAMDRCEREWNVTGFLGLSNFPKKLTLDSYSCNFCAVFHLYWDWSSIYTSESKWFLHFCSFQSQYGVWLNMWPFMVNPECTLLSSFEYKAQLDRKSEYNVHLPRIFERHFSNWASGLFPVIALGC